MNTILYVFLLPFFVLIAYSFLLFRFSYFSQKELSGRYPFLFGGVLVFASAVWQGITTTAAYQSWFLESAYPIIDIIHFIIFILGVLLTVAGLALYADHWQTKREELHEREQKISLLADMQRDARQPYHLLQLLEITIKEMVRPFDQTAGALFLMQSSRRHLVLTASAGLTKTEIAQLERYPLSQNTVAQAIELGDPVIAGMFEFTGKDKTPEASRFQSTLILPLVSGTDKIGCILLVSEQKQYFTATEVKYLAPAGEWLAEKIKTTRLQRDISNLQNQNSSLSSQISDFQKRLSITSEALSSGDVIEKFCRALVGLFDASAVHLYGLKNNALTFYGGSEPLLDLSESYKTALLDALGRDKPLIVNQESKGTDGRKFITRSTLIYPLVNSPGQAMIFIKDSSPIATTEQSLQLVSIYARLASVALARQTTMALDITRKKGLEKIISLLKLDQSLTFEQDPAFMLEHLQTVVPSKAAGLSLVKHNSGSFKAVGSPYHNSNEVSGFELFPGEGFLEQINSSGECQFYYGRGRIDAVIQQFDEPNRDQFVRLFGEDGLPLFLAICPVYQLDSLKGVVLYYFYDISETERAEWQRMLTLAFSLYTIRLTIHNLNKQPQAPDTAIEILTDDHLMETYNKINNYLMAISWQAEMLLDQPDLRDEQKQEYQNIIDQSDQAAELLKDKLAPTVAFEKQHQPESKPSLIDIIDKVLIENKISDNLYMIGGKPREIYHTSRKDLQLMLEIPNFRNLFEEALARFALQAEDDDILTINAYQKSNMLYLDISRHHKNFPPVDPVAGFGQYYPVNEVLKHRPADRFLAYLADEICFYAYDRLAVKPTYISFQFPYSPQQPPSTDPQQKLSILAIDDQPLILDLISAMCQTSGFDVTTAESGEQGLKLFQNGTFDIILTDLAMPGMSGLEVAREIKKIRSDIPIILITGWGVTIDQSQLDNAGISIVLYKPFKIEQLSEVIVSLNPHFHRS